MKSILYVGATLMIGASIYGFVDYQQTSHKKEFSEMYKEPVPVAEEKKTEIAIEPAVVKSESIKEKELTESKTAVAAVKKETKKVVKKKKSRKLDSKMFSRGALDERYLKEEIKLEEKVKVEPVKTETKEL